MKISAGAAILTIITMLFFAVRAMALAPGEAQIVSVNVQGDGCPDGSVHMTLAPDASAFTVLYDAFTVATTGTQPMVERNCRVVAQIRKPRDMGVSVEGVDFRGFVQLDDGVRAGQVVRVVSGQHGGQQGRQSDFGFERWLGPIASNFIIRSLLAGNRVGDINCVSSDTTKLIVASRVRIQGARAGKSGMITVDSADGELMQKYMLNWQDCRPRGGGGGGNHDDDHGGRGRGDGRGGRR